MENNDFLNNGETQQPLNNAEPNNSQNLYENKIQQLRDTVSRVIIGQEKSVDLLLTAILANGHVLLEGVPGVAKTLTARLVAKLIEADFSRIQFTSDIMPSDILGTSIFNMGNHQFEFHPGPVFGDIILVDEINRAPAKTQSALFEVMEERQATIDGKKYPMGDTYTIIATQNPIEQEGTYRLPEAQMDRFMFKITVGYPDQESEVAVLRSHNGNQNFTRLENINPILTKHEISDIRKAASNIFVDDKILNYIVQIVQQSRQHQSIYVGASPRASIALLNASKAYAMINGRNYVVPSDVKELSVPVLQHRISLTAEAEMDGVTVQQVIEEMFSKTVVPN